MLNPKQFLHQLFRDANDEIFIILQDGTEEQLAKESDVGGGYASLTGAGQTTTPGDLTQAGGLTVDDSAGDGIDMTSSTGGGNGTELALGSDVTLLPVTAPAALGQKQTSHVAAIYLGARSSVAEDGVAQIAGTDDVQLLAPSVVVNQNGAGSGDGFALYTAANEGALPTPPDVGHLPAWGFTQTGHIYFNTGSGWTLVS